MLRHAYTFVLSRNLQTRFHERGALQSSRVIGPENTAVQLVPTQQVTGSRIVIRGSRVASSKDLPRGKLEVDERS
jgi:hypothetical protein